MFEPRELDGELEALREAEAPGAIVLDTEGDFETLPPEQAEELALVTERLDPASAPTAWLSPDAPEILQTYASETFTVGMPGDGSVVWTRQTDPPVLICKPRLDESPADFRDFLIAEALVQVGLDVPEHFLGFFEARYPEFARVAGAQFDPNETYQLAAACYDAALGLQTRDVFAAWDGELFAAWLDAGEHIETRVRGLPSALARGETSFPDASELACSAIKHAAELPAPFDALDTTAYLDHGPEYAIKWLERTLAELE
jgi:hypothetical protein